MKKIYLMLGISLMLSSLLFAQPCLQNEIKVTSQNQMNALQGCNYIYGNIEISGTVNSLQSLSKVTTINGDLVITDNDVQNLWGLENLRSVSGSVIIRSNQKLTSLSYLYNLQSVGNALIIENNNNLVDLKGLERLRFYNNEQDIYVYANNKLVSLNGLEGVTNIDDLKIHDNYALVDFKGLNNVTSINFLELERNFSLQNFDGLQNVTISNSISVEKNKSLQNFIGLDNLEEINGWFYVDNNNNLLNFEGLGSLKYIKSSFQVKNNNKLKSLYGIGQLQSIRKNLSINSNNELRNLRGLSSLESISGELNIYSNGLLNNISALSQLTSIDGDLIISDNTALKSLSGIDNIDYQGIDRLEITTCNNLKACQVNSICNFISNRSNYDISRNAYDCSTSGLVQSNCSRNPLTPPNELDIQNNVQGDYAIDVLNYNDWIKVEVVRLKRPDSTNPLFYHLVNQSGVVAEEGDMLNQVEINLSNKENDLYYLFIQDNQGFLFVEKFVKQD